ncbi:cytochrome P450 [Crucibulum laeve]|uniref:Cytochrome P450 n=1 Tax=Crucibulum laeve TaxID=68775 RepID=A0A5C3LZ71_9AGAR|nr:cytochrome P450 [Crucibulum laeve]
MFDAVAPWLTLAILLLFIYSKLKKPSNLPPGPPASMLGDNTRDVPAIRPWRTFMEWRKRYGNVMSFYLGRTPVIVLGSLKAATDLLDKRGNIYSSRPRNIVAGDIYSGGMRGISMPYGKPWRNWRSLMQAGMSVDASKTYEILQSIESKILLRDLLHAKDVGDYLRHIRRFSASIVFCVSYGRRLASLDDEVISTTQKIEECILPGKFIVESWPILLALPRFLQWFRWDPEKRRSEDTEFYLSLMNSVRDRMKLGIAQPCTATRALHKQADFGLDDIQSAYALSAPSQAGVGTVRHFTILNIRLYKVAMILFPDAMRKAQAELDIIVGMDTLPGFEHEPSLTYLQALIKETLRWRAIVPTGLPHSTIADDVYEGMYIPKGSTVYANIYAMTRDPEMFPEPDNFRPERFLNTDDARLANYTINFGFGRRICPGMHVANRSLFIFISRVLWAFDIVPPKRADGKPILPPSDDFTTGLTSHPKPFGYSFVPRRAGVEPIIMKEALQAEMDAAAWM